MRGEGNGISKWGSKDFRPFEKSVNFHGEFPVRVCAREVSIFLVVLYACRMKEEGRVGGNMLFEDVE